MDDIDSVKGSIFAELGEGGVFTPNKTTVCFPGGGYIFIRTKVFLETSEILHFISFYPPPPPPAPCYFKPASCKLQGPQSFERESRTDGRASWSPEWGAIISSRRCLKFHSGVSILVNLRWRLAAGGPTAAQRAAIHDTRANDLWAEAGIQMPSCLRRCERVCWLWWSGPPSQRRPASN